MKKPQPKTDPKKPAPTTARDMVKNTPPKTGGKPKKIGK